MLICASEKGDRVIDPVIRDSDLSLFDRYSIMGEGGGSPIDFINGFIECMEIRWRTGQLGIRGSGGRRGLRAYT